MRSTVVIGILFLAAASQAWCDEPGGPASGQTRPTPAPGCDAQLAVRLVNPKSSGDGQMVSQLLVRNEGMQSCSLPGLPRIDFMDAGDHSLGLYRQVPIGMHPGPVIVPALLGPGAVAVAQVSWPSAGKCITPAKVAITFLSTTVKHDWIAPLCGASADKIRFNQTPLSTQR
jgi:hypothetical protein